MLNRTFQQGRGRQYNQLKQTLQKWAIPAARQAQIHQVDMRHFMTLMKASSVANASRSAQRPQNQMSLLSMRKANFSSEGKDPKKDDNKDKEENDDVPDDFKKLMNNMRKPGQKKKEDDSKKASQAKKEEDSDDELTELEDEPKKKEDTQKSHMQKLFEQFKKEEKDDGNKDDKKSQTWQEFFKANQETFAIASLMTGGLAYAMYNMNTTQSEEVTYIDFINNYLAKNQVEMITITEDKSSDTFKYRANIDTLQGNRIHLVLPQVENFLYKLDLAQREMGKDPNNFVPVKYGISEQDANPATNMMVGMSFLLLLMLIYRAMHGRNGKTGTGSKTQGKSGPGGAGGQGGIGDFLNMGKSNAQVFGVDKKIRTRFKHVAGMSNAKTEIMEFVDFLKAPEKYKKLGAKVPKGALLVGPPGTGKTLLAKAVAGEAGVPFLSISGSDFVQMYVGVGASRVRDLFKQAKELSPSIIFIDEIDAVAKKRDQKMGGNDERDNTLNQLLVEMDGFTTDENVVVLAATNLADVLDKAVLRPGRFDRQVEITLPSIDERKEIYNVHLKKIKVNKEKSRDEYAQKMSALTPGFSGADIANICNEGAIIAARKDKKSVSLKEFEEATERVIGGLERKNIMTPQERKTVAYHEAGHAVAGWFLEHSNPLLKVTIIPRSKGALGFAQYLPEEISLYTREQLIDMICVALGGRIAEDMFFKKITTGASDDIKKVTQIAQSLVNIYGMSNSIGLVSYQSDNDFVKPYSEETNYEIDLEVKQIVDECYQRTYDLLESKREQIEALAEELLEQESINLPTIIKVLGERPFELKASVKEYLQELESRKQAEEAAEEEDKNEDDDAEEVDAAEELKEDDKKEEKDNEKNK